MIVCVLFAERLYLSSAEKLIKFLSVQVSIFY